MSGLNQFTLKYTTTQLPDFNRPYLAQRLAIKTWVRNRVKGIADHLGITQVGTWQVDGIKVYIISYPKSGRTWLRSLLGKALCESYGIEERCMLNTHLVTRYAKVLPTQFSHDMNGSELWNELETDKSRYRHKKVVFLARQPHDVMVSFYFHMKNRNKKFNGSISEFIRSDRWGIKKLLKFNDIWYSNQDIFEDFLLIKYEDMHKDTNACLFSLLNFIGARDVPKSVIKNTVEFCNIENMRKREIANQLNDHRLSSNNINDQEALKVRKGKIGGYIDYLSKEDIDYIDQVILERGNPWY